MNGRRQALAFLGAEPWLAAPAVGAEPGVIGALVPFTGFPPDADLRWWLRKMGETEAETQKIVVRSSEGRDELLPKLAVELAALRPSVILTWGDPGARAAQAATTRIPVVVMSPCMNRWRRPSAGPTRRACRPSSHGASMPMPVP